MAPQSKHVDILAVADQQAARTSAEFDSSLHRGIILRVKVGAAAAGAPTYTPRLEIKLLGAPDWKAIWTAAAAQAVSTDLLYAIGADAVDAGGFQETVAVPIGPRMRVVIAGGDAGNHADTQAEAVLTI